MYQISINLIYCLIENANREGKTLSSIHLVFSCRTRILTKGEAETNQHKQISINLVSNLNLSVMLEQSAERSLYGLA